MKQYTTCLIPNRPTLRGPAHGEFKEAIELPNRRGNWVFFVAYGKKQGDYEFDEAISTECELRLQSHPQQSLDDARINSWIHHDETKHTIHLFLRSAARSDPRGS